jgi:hypothetical protein
MPDDQTLLGILSAQPLDYSVHLTDGPIHWFSDWPTGNVPRSGAVVYTIWNREGAFTDVDMSGRSFI